MLALIGIWKIWNIGRFMSDSPLQGLWQRRSPPALVLRQPYGRNHCMWSVRRSVAAETPVRNFCCKVIESKSGLRVYPNLSVAQGMIRNQSRNTASFENRKYVFFISDWEWDKFLSHKKKRLRIRNKQNVASCCDLHNHPKNSFGCKDTIFNRG